MMSITDRIHSTMTRYVNAVVGLPTKHPQDKIENDIEIYINDLVNLGEVRPMSYYWHQDGITMYMMWIATDDPFDIVIRVYEFPHLSGNVAAPDPIADYDRAMRGI